MNVCPQCGNAFDDPAEVCPVDHFKLLSLDSADDPMLGKLLDGRYRLIRKVGEGGMGSIYRAVHTEMSRTCAIKLLTALSPGKDDAIARFKREAKNSSRIDNVHAVTIYDFGQADDGMLFLAMEFIDGIPLSRVLAEQRVLPIERVIHLTDQIAEALAAAHALGIVHRDLKPDNIMITHKGAETDYVKVLDFGIAKTIADESGDNLTKTGFVLGTPVYMSPEQLLGEKLDGRSDIYSLAIIVYEMLSGRLPFDGDNPQAVMMKRVMSDPIRLRAVAPSVSESLERAVMAGLRRDPDARTPNAEAFASELGRALYTGTQIMGGVVTRKLTEPGVARATHERTGYGTSPESNPFTREAESASGSSFDNVPAWGATEISFPPAAPDVIKQPPLNAHARDGAAVAVAPEATVVSKPRPRIGRWVWLGSALAVAAIAAILFLVIPFGSANSFTLVVKGAPEGSEVFVNETRREAVIADGELRVSGLDPGPVTVRVLHVGYADFITRVSGAKGEVQICEAQLLAEIDYNGEMVPIPAGEFLMGDDGHADERPTHPVTLLAYYIDKYEVTNAQYQKFCDDTRRPPPPNPPFDPEYFTSKLEYPVLGVTIDDALDYADWAGKRLATEQEWEKAASWDSLAQKKRLYPWGDDFDSGHANIGTGHPVRVTESNGDRSSYGVRNMAGNACEWVAAAWQPYEGNTSPTLDYSKDEIVIRGGTFSSASKNNEARTSYRNHLPKVFPKGKSAPVGIRCVVPADDPRIQQLLKARSK